MCARTSWASRSQSLHIPNLHHPLNDGLLQVEKQPSSIHRISCHYREIPEIHFEGAQSFIPTVTGEFGRGEEVRVDRYSASKSIHIKFVKDSRTEFPMQDDWLIELVVA